MPVTACTPKYKLVRAISKESEVRKEDVENVLRALQAVLAQELREHGKVLLPGVVKLELRRRPAKPERPYQRPHDGSTVIYPPTPERVILKAWPLKALKEETL